MVIHNAVVQLKPRPRLSAQPLERLLNSAFAKACDLCKFFGFGDTRKLQNGQQLLRGGAGGLETDRLDIGANVL